MNTKHKNTFTKDERLSKKKIIDDLFSSGHTTKVPPFTILWKKVELSCSYPAQIAISVPKKRIRKVVVRNKLKRRIREAYRKNKHLLYQELKLHNTQCAIFIIFNANELMEYNEIEQKIILTLNRLIKDIITKTQT